MAAQFSRLGRYIDIYLSMYTKAERVRNGRGRKDDNQGKKEIRNEKGPEDSIHPIYLLVESNEI